MSADENRLSGKRWNRITSDGVKWYRQQVDRLKEELLADGYPPFSVPASPQVQYQNLVAMKQAGDPRYWSDPRAQKRLTELEAQFGVATPAGPLGPPGPYPGGRVF